MEAYISWKFGLKTVGWTCMSYAAEAPDPEAENMMSHGDVNDWAKFT